MTRVGLLVPLSALALAGAALSTGPTSTTASLTAPVARTGAPSTAPALDRAQTTTGSDQLSPTHPGRWAWPLQPQPAVVRPFVRPATSYGAGHRGVDLAAGSGQEVRAVDAGVVTHVGSIAGRGTVSVLHASGIRSTYEPLDPAVVAGSAVARGGLLGRLQESGTHCDPALCLHLGALRGHTYLDPIAFLQYPRRVRLLPLSDQAPEG